MNINMVWTKTNIYGIKLPRGTIYHRTDVRGGTLYIWTGGNILLKNIHNIQVNYLYVPDSKKSLMYNNMSENYKLVKKRAYSANHEYIVSMREFALGHRDDILRLYWENAHDTKCAEPHSRTIGVYPKQRIYIKGDAASSPQIEYIPQKSGYIIGRRYISEEGYWSR